MGINFRTFDIVRIRKRIIQTLMTVYEFNIDICHQVFIGQVNVDIYKVNVFLIRLERKLSVLS